MAAVCEGGRGGKSREMTHLQLVSVGPVREEVIIFSQTVDKWFQYSQSGHALRKTLW